MSYWQDLTLRIFNEIFSASFPVLLCGLAACSQGRIIHFLPWEIKQPVPQKYVMATKSSHCLRPWWCRLSQSHLHLEFFVLKFCIRFIPLPFLSVTDTHILTSFPPSHVLVHSVAETNRGWEVRFSHCLKVFKGPTETVWHELPARQGCGHGDNGPDGRPEDHTNLTCPVRPGTRQNGDRLAAPPDIRTLSPRQLPFNRRLDVWVWRVSRGRGVEFFCFETETHQSLLDRRSPGRRSITSSSGKKTHPLLGRTYCHGPVK